MVAASRTARRGGNCASPVPARVIQGPRAGNFKDTHIYLFDHRLIRLGLNKATMCARSLSDCAENNFFIDATIHPLRSLRLRLATQVEQVDEIESRSRHVREGSVAWIQQNEIRERPKSCNATPGFRSARPDYDVRKEGKRNADRRVSFPPRLAGAAACSAEYARLSAFHHGSSLGIRHRQGAAHRRAKRRRSTTAIAMLPGTWRSADPVVVPIPGAEPTQFVRALPALDLSQSSEHLAAQSVVLGG